MSVTTPRFWLVIPAAGSGQRMQSSCPKQYLSLHGRYILDITLSCVLDQLDVSGCVVAISADDAQWQQTEASRDHRVQRCTGGKHRADSVLAALDSLEACASDDDWVLVHDAARPCLHPDDLAKLVLNVQAHQVGGLLAAPVADTLKQAMPGTTNVQATVDRQNLWRAFTPQMFRYGLLKTAMSDARTAGLAVTDEASAMENAGYTPCIVEGRPDNIKVTVPADLALTDFILSRF